MARTERFEDLEAWQMARAVVCEIYRLFRTTALGRDYRLRDQITASGVSIMNNIAEGFERLSLAHKRYFYDVARGSCGETRSLTYVCEDAGYFTKETADGLRMSVLATGRLITGLMRSTQRAIDAADGADSPASPISDLPSPATLATGHPE